MWIGGNKKSGASIDDIAELMNCKVLMPFTDDLLDHSIIKKATGVVTGTINLNDNGAVFTRTQNMYIDCPLNVADDYTIEILVTITNDTHEAYFLGGQGANTFYLCYTNNTKSFYFGRHGSNALKDLSTVVELNKMYHIALVMDKGTYKAYINGKQVTSIDINSIKPTANTTRIYLGRPYSDLNVTDYSLDGVVGGLKITSKALQPSEFSLTRPFKLPEVDFQRGNKTFLFKSGILDPRISLPSNVQIKNNCMTPTSNAKLIFHVEEAYSRTLFMSAHGSNIGSSDGTRFCISALNNDASLGDAIAIFSGGKQYSCRKIAGLDFSSFSNVNGQSIQFNCMADQIFVEEIWYE